MRAMKLPNMLILQATLYESCDDAAVVWRDSIVMIRADFQQGMESMS